MLIECVSDKPLRLVGPRLKVAMVLRPGEPLEVDPGIGRHLIGHPSQKIRISRIQWVNSWRELAAMTASIGEDDPIFEPILRGLGECDVAFEHESWEEFSQAFQSIKSLLEERRRERSRNPKAD